jgi:hypothetical protein
MPGGAAALAAAGNLQTVGMSNEESLTSTACPSRTWVPVVLRNHFAADAYGSEDGEHRPALGALLQSSQLRRVLV